MITSAPSLPPTEPNASVLAALRATPLGASLEADPARWQIDEAHATSYATHLVLSRRAASEASEASGDDAKKTELRIALARDGSGVVEEDWHVRVERFRPDAASLGERILDLARAVESAAENAQELLGAIGRSEGSGPHERWTLRIALPLEELEERATAIGLALRDAAAIALDAAEAAAESAPR